MGVHSGREYKKFKSRVTQGCVRTTCDGMEAIQDAIDQYGDLRDITIEDNYVPSVSEREDLSLIEAYSYGVEEMEIPLPESDLRLPNNIPAQNQDYPINIPQRDSFWDRY
jgi:hypothetical protein